MLLTRQFVKPSSHQMATQEMQSLDSPIPIQTFTASLTLSANSNSGTLPNPTPLFVESSRLQQKGDQPVNCPKCNSTKTKFCYYSNDNLTQPRYLCKACHRYWTEGASHRNFPVGGGSRKNKIPSSLASSLPHPGSSSNATNKPPSCLNLGFSTFPCMESIGTNVTAAHECQEVESLDSPIPIQTSAASLNPSATSNSGTLPNPRPLFVERSRPQNKGDQPLNCPRCNSTNTKFCYYNNYSLNQPRYFCKACCQYWTEGASLRNLPVRGGSRNKRALSSLTSSITHPAGSSSNTTNKPQSGLNIFPSLESNTNVSAASTSKTVSVHKYGAPSWLQDLIMSAQKNSTDYSGFPTWDRSGFVSGAVGATGVNEFSGSTHHVQNSGRSLFPFLDLKPMGASTGGSEQLDPNRGQLGDENQPQRWFWNDIMDGGSGSGTGTDAGTGETGMNTFPSLERNTNATAASSSTSSNTVDKYGTGSGLQDLRPSTLQSLLMSIPEYNTFKSQDTMPAYLGFPTMPATVGATGVDGVSGIHRAKNSSKFLLSVKDLKPKGASTGESDQLEPNSGQSADANQL